MEPVALTSMRMKVYPDYKNEKVLTYDEMMTELYLGDNGECFKERTQFEAMLESIKAMGITMTISIPVDYNEVVLEFDIPEPE